MIQNQSEEPVFSCMLIGSTNLLIECYELLKGRNWDIVAVFTNDIPVSNYFNSLEVPVTSNTESIFPSLKKKRFDYLFSIVNEHILPKEILSIPEKGAINYHDSCLPEGAGVYATTWAIINKHKTHGITWHLMDEGIDTGEILEQKIIDIAPEDTSFVLNAKCFAEAIDSFKILLDNIEMGSLHPKKQDLIKRTYYPFNKRPQNFGFIDFRAEESLWEPNLRAFYFGKNDNFFCTPKVCLKGHIYVLNGYNWNNDKLPFEPGQIKIIDNAILQVKCTKRVLNIKKLTTLFGEVVSIQDLIKYHCLKEGDRFEYPDSTFLDSLFQYTKSAISEEKYWINRLTHLDLADFPMQNVIHYETDSVNKPIYRFTLNEETFQLCMNSNNNEFFSNCTALLLMYISRLLDRANYDIWFQSNSVGSILASCYSEKVPLNVTLNKTRNCRDTLNKCSDTISLVSKKPSFCLDIFQRIRYLKETDQKALFRRKPFLIEWQNDSSCERVDENIDWKLVISEKKKTIDLISSKNVVNHAIGKIFFHHFKVFIRNLVQWPQQTLGSIKMLSDDELSTKIFEYNNLKVPYPDSKCVNELINEWIEKTPGEVALVCEGRQLTYGSLGEKANRISHCLHSLNVNPGELIGIKMKRSENVIISYLAIWNMGCAYVPLDPELPGTRIQYMIDNANVKIVITDDDNDEFNVASLNFNHALSSPIADKPLLLPGKKPALAYVKYTSGSTGLPKGVMISHENIIVFLYSYREVVGVKNKRIGTCVAPLSFDTSVDEIYSCICFGGTAHIMMKQQVLDLSYFSNYLADNKINVSYIIPEFLEGVGKHLKNQPQVFLKTILTGLHAKKNRAFKNFFGLSSEIRVLNAYGPTEVTYGSSAYRVSGTEPGDEYTPIGKPFPNYQTFIVDSEMHILPDFVAGELLIAGSALSSGYINNSETTREKFVDFSYGDSKTRVYKTGDRVCYLPSGDVAFIGRNDDQVKISGYRIELGEIEEALLKISNIRQSLVLTKNIGSLGYRIMAYIVFENKSVADVQQVESELRSRLPAYMVPSFFVPLD
ncbi:MAG: amino acid adenylation domain-containing protein, partial [Prolixibacteraceae bacterium]|nr:amino acid adenylation domain-containing protein [Prolixibacteraceae bacterium]